MDITEYCKSNSIMSKIRAALEQIEVGNGYTVLDGLQAGSVILALVNDGETVHFEAMPKPVLVVATPPELADSPILTHESDAEKPRRKKHSEDT